MFRFLIVPTAIALLGLSLDTALAASIKVIANANCAGVCVPSVEEDRADSGDAPFRSSLSVSTDLWRGGIEQQAYASVNYQSGVLGTSAATIVADNFRQDTNANDVSIGEVDLRSGFDFLIAPAIVDPFDVTVVFEILHTVDDYGFADFVPENFSSNNLVSSSFSVSGRNNVSDRRRITTSGTTVFQQTFTVSPYQVLPSQPAYNMRWLLRSRGDTSFASNAQLPDLVPENGRVIDFSGLASATGRFNFLTPEGVTIQGDEPGFLSTATLAAVPLPAPMLLLIGGLAALSCLRLGRAA